MGIDGRDDAAKPPCEALWRQSSQPQSMCKAALPSAKGEFPSVAQWGYKNGDPNPNHSATLLHAIRYYRRH